MGKKDKDKKTRSSGFVREITSVLLLALAIFLGLALISYNAWDPGLSTISSSQGPIYNWGGLIGAILADVLLLGFGMAAYAIPLAIFCLALLVFFEHKVGLNLARTGTALIFLAALATLISISGYFGPELKDSGGLVGFYLGRYLTLFLGRPGGIISLSALLLVSLVLTTRLRLASVSQHSLTGLRRAGQTTLKYGRRLSFYLGHQLKKLLQLLGWHERSLEDGYQEILRDGHSLIKSKKTRQKGRRKRGGKKEEKVAEEESVPELPKEFKTKGPAGQYLLPPLDLLDDPPEVESEIDRQELMANATLLENKLKDFGVFGKVVEINPGPIITMYEFEPAPGVKVNKIVALSDDLALALKAISVRIVAPIPGKAVVGIEIPNRSRETVYLKEILASEDFVSSNSPLPLCLGKDIGGGPMTADLKKMPHLLVAGATGSGKSVGLNAMIVSILYRSTPEEVKLLMVDPKMLELSLYDGIPHLLLPVVTDPRKAATALRWAVNEMERRYRLLADLGVRNIDSYNRKIGGRLKEKQAEFKTAVQLQAEREEVAQVPEEHTGPLPHLVIIIDEFADLMVVSSKDVEDSLTRLAQMARAAGLHLILATQRPSVDVITGIIKANFSARLSFQVFSRTDSRTILDSMGAEKLLGEGDMLFLPPGTSRLERIHGCYVHENEVKTIAAYLKQQATPQYDEEILKFKDQAVEGEELEEEHDEMYDQALALVGDAKTVSISMIQRRLRIGYNRAARMIERMEREGIVGTADPGKPREVLRRNYDLEA